jgi:hypothetical protein
MLVVRALKKASGQIAPGRNRHREPGTSDTSGGREHITRHEPRRHPPDRHGTPRNTYPRAQVARRHQHRNRRTDLRLHASLALVHL